MSNSELINRSKKEVLNVIQNAGKNKTTKSLFGIPLQLILSIVLGTVFGFLMNKSHVYLAPIIRDQMLFKRLTMFKMFLAAVGMSMLSVVLILLIDESIYRRTLNGFIQKINRIDVIHLVVGGSLIGVGMVLAGSCPGTIFVQIGSGLPNSFITALGACCGVLFYYLFISKFLAKSELPKSSLVLQELPDRLGYKRLYLNLLFGLIFLSLSFILEYFLPYKNDSVQSNGWSPTWCGVGVGLLQLFFMIFFEKSLGISTGFTVIVAQLCRVKFFEKLIPSLNSFTYGTQNNSTLLFAIGAITGSFISTISANQFPLDEQYGANVRNSFLGGFLLLIGARCAGGCTSGQGISGVTHLLIGSLLATAAMFGGGIVFAISYGLITNDWHFSSL